jgi:hypothetical protein
MVVEFELETEFLSDLLLNFFDRGIVELHHLAAISTEKMIVMFFFLGGFIKGVAIGFETLFDHAGFKQDRDIPVDRIARDLEAFFLKTLHKFIHIEMTVLALDALEKTEPFFGQTKPFVMDKPFEFFFIFYH